MTEQHYRHQVHYMSPEDRSERDPLQSLIAEILDAENRGETVDRDSLLAEHPDYADSLREFFASQACYKNRELEMKNSSFRYTPTR